MNNFYKTAYDSGVDQALQDHYVKLSSLKSLLSKGLDAVGPRAQVSLMGAASGALGGFVPTPDFDLEGAHRRALKNPKVLFRVDDTTTTYSPLKGIGGALLGASVGRYAGGIGKLHSLLNPKALLKPLKAAHEVALGEVISKSIAKHMGELSAVAGDVAATQRVAKDFANPGWKDFAVNARNYAKSLVGA